MGRASEREPRRELDRDAAPAEHTATVSPAPFTELFDAHVDTLYRYVFRRCRDHALSEDITQEAFLTALRQTDPDTITIGWLTTVARNRLLDVMRRRLRYEAKLRLVGAAGLDENHIDPAERLRVEQALAELSVDQRLALTLHYIDGLTVREMADELGRSVKSVEGLITRARRALRHELEDDAGRRWAGGDHD